MNRNVLVIGFVVLLGAAIGLWLWSRKSDDVAPSPAQPTKQVAPVIVGSDQGSHPTVAPSLPGSAAAPEGSDKAREYTVGDIQVRDHRAGDQAKIDIPPNVHPPESRELPSILTHDIGQKVKAVMAQCAAEVPREARGPAPRLEGQIIVAIKDHQLTVKSSTMQLRDVFGAALEPTKQCIEQKSLGLATAAADQADMDSYSINLTFAMP